MKRILFFMVFVFMLCSAAVSADELTGGYIPVTAEPVSVSENDGEEESFFIDTYTVTANLGNTAEISADKYYGYNMLLEEDERLAAAYECIVNGMAQKAERIDISEFQLTAEELYKVFNVCINDCPQLFYADVSGYSYSNTSPYVKFIFPGYIDVLTADNRKTELEEAAAEIIQSSGARENMSDYDKAVMLHNEIALYVKYNTNALEEINEVNAMADSSEKDEAIAVLNEKYPNIHSAYGALVEGDAVCDGYSKAYQYLLYKMGIVSHIATGTGNGGAHAWNLVKLDGKWYYTDVTWDDAEEKGIFYAYFNMNDEQLADSAHILDGLYTMPECNSSDLNYFTKNGGIMTADGDFENVTAQLKENFYARVYITGDKASIKDIWEWYKSQLAAIAKEVGLSSGTAGYIASGREYHLVIYYDAAQPLENAALELTSSADKSCDIFAVFYDENDIITGINKIDNVKINANSVNIINCTKVPDRFKKIGYFIWDSADGMIPLYEFESIEY